MYKKIKNGSFMNLFWFIICLLPLIFLFIYSFSFLNDKEQNYKKINNDFDFKNITLNTITNLELNQNTNIFETISEPSSTIRVIQFDFQYEDNFVLYSYINTSSTNMILSLRIFFNDETYQSINLTNIHEYIFNINEIILNDNKTKEDINRLRIAYRLTSSETNTTLSIFKTNNLLNNEQKAILLTNNYNVIQNLNNIQSYLKGIYTTFESNGFINNTLLQVINYFNVNNVYMQLAILYIEYFIIIQLLHLFVDFMLLIPNICHKFMEKVGGERD